MKRKEPKHWQENSSDKVADCRVFKIINKKFTHPDGRTGNFFVKDSPDWVQVAGLVEDDLDEPKVILVNQFRFGTKNLSWEFSGGIIDAGESAIKSAKRELLEETGYAGENAKIIAKISPNPAIQNNSAYVVIIRNCKKVAQTNWDPNEEIQTRLVPLSKLDNYVKTKKIHHSIAINGVYFLQKYLEELNKNALK